MIDRHELDSNFIINVNQRSKAAYTVSFVARIDQTGGPNATRGPADPFIAVIIGEQDGRRLVWSADPADPELREALEAEAWFRLAAFQQQLAA